MTDAITPANLPPLQLPTRQLPQLNLQTGGDDAALRDAAQSFEATFLAEMFSHAGLGEARKSNGGGVGEDAFSSLLSREWADRLAENGGIGIAEHIYEALVAREGSK